MEGSPIAERIEDVTAERLVRREPLARLAVPRACRHLVPQQGQVAHGAIEAAPLEQVTLDLFGAAQVIARERRADPLPRISGALGAIAAVGSICAALSAATVSTMPSGRCGSCV